MIYKMNYKDIKRQMYEFHKTIYGKTMFVICYSLFFWLFVFCIFSLIFDLLSFEYFIVLIMICLISFLIGSYCFYKELRIFVNNKYK